MSDVIVKDAYLLATEAHRGQVDKAGEPYIAHPIAVAESVRHMGNLHQIVAVLHDVVEDTEITVDELRLRFGDDVAETVDALSRRDSEQYFDFIRRVKRHPVAREVKIADLRHNLSRIESLPPSLKTRYEFALVMLGAVG